MRWFEWNVLFVKGNLRKGEVFYGDIGTYYEGKPLCECCYYESEPAAVVYYGKDENPCVISETRNETDGDFRVFWVRTDPWRGYYQTKSERYVLVNTAELLAYHQSERMLKKFDERIKELFDEHGIDYARIFARSSNVFYQNYDLYVRKDQEKLARILIQRVKEEVDYDNPKWCRNIVFNEEALKLLAELFPERNIKTDYEALELLEKIRVDLAKEIQKRIAEKKKGLKILDD